MPKIFSKNINYCHYFFEVFIYLAMLCLSRDTWESLVGACGIQFPDQGANPGPLHWEHGVLATGPPGKSPLFLIDKLYANLSESESCSGESDSLQPQGLPGSSVHGILQARILE